MNKKKNEKEVQSEFAVKFYKWRESDVLKDRAGRLWLREGKMLYICQGHPNIVKSICAGVDRYFNYLVMEPLSGGELWTRIRNRDEITESEAHHLFQQLASAVNHCHSRGVVHRDIKPSVSVSFLRIVLMSRDGKTSRNIQFRKVSPYTMHYDLAVST